MNKPFALNRRHLLQSLGSLTLSFAIPLDMPLAQAPPKLAGRSRRSVPNLSAWLRINADGTVTLMIGKVELGQGILTAVAQVCADELDVDIERIKIVSGDTALVPNEGTTAGSQSMPGCAPARAAGRSGSAPHPARARGRRSSASRSTSLKVEDGTIRGPAAQRRPTGNSSPARNSSARPPARCRSSRFGASLSSASRCRASTSRRR